MMSPVTLCTLEVQLPSLLQVFHSTVSNLSAAGHRKPSYFTYAKTLCCSKALSQDTLHSRTLTLHLHHSDHCYPILPPSGTMVILCAVFYLANPLPQMSVSPPGPLPLTQ